MVNSSTTSWQRQRCFQGVQANKHRIANTLLSMFQVMARAVQLRFGVRNVPNSRNAPVLLIGKAKCSIDMRRFLSNNFLTVIINEAMSSQRCPKCHDFLIVVPDTRFRRWTCPNIPCNQYTTTDNDGVVRTDNTDFNKDTSATLHFIYIFLFLIHFGKRPLPFCTSTQRQLFYPVPQNQ
jgi:hypothetical protein